VTFWEFAQAHPVFCAVGVLFVGAVLEDLIYAWRRR
jgi:hypothetical protein